MIVSCGHFIYALFEPATSGPWDFRTLIPTTRCTSCFFCFPNFFFFSRTLPIERMIIYLIFALTQYQNDIVSSVCEVLEKLKAKREITCFVKLFRWKTKWADKLYKPYKKLRFSESKRHREFWLRSFGKTTNKERDNNSREFILTKN